MKKSHMVLTAGIFSCPRHRITASSDFMDTLCTHLLIGDHSWCHGERRTAAVYLSSG